MFTNPQWLLSICLGIFSAAALYAQEASHLLPDQDPDVTTGYAKLEAGNPDDALADFDKALATNANNIEALLGQAMIYSKKREHSSAFSSYDSIVQLAPANAFAWNGRGLAAFNMEDFDEALNSFEHAAAEAPSGFFLESLAWVRMCRGEYEQAATVAKRSSLMYSKSGEKTVYPLLIAYFAQLESGALEDAATTLRYALSNSPSYEWPLPVIKYLSGKLSAAEMISYVTAPSQETEAHTYIGLKLRAEGQMDASKQHLDWVSRKGDPSSVFEYTLARAMNLQSSVAVIDRTPAVTID